MNNTQVCKSFFLSKLGMRNNDKFIRSAHACLTPNKSSPAADRRGKHVHPFKLNREDIEADINKYKPSISHYRRAHAPNRLYLPSELNVKDMYTDYINNGGSGSYESYRKVVKEMHISFTKLGCEECDCCVEHAFHMKHCVAEDCEECSNHENHRKNVETTRKLYRTDAELPIDPQHVYRSVDLQKIILLPRIPGSKQSIFTPRLSVYHKTFAPLGEAKDKPVTISTLWHQAIAGRKAEEITSAFHQAILSDRDAKTITYWMDNCSSQNKNWTLNTSLLTLVNSDETTVEKITLKFLEAGHTFMSADSVHHGVELAMKRRLGGNIHDFEDFLDTVRSSNSGKIKIIEMKNAMFRRWTDGHSAYRVAKYKGQLAPMCLIEFRRETKDVFFYKTEFTGPFKKFNFLKKNFIVGETPGLLRENNRGIDAARKKGIVDNLCPIMPANRRPFWQNMNVLDGVDYGDDSADDVFDV